jgi:hypothetical protein
MKKYCFIVDDYCRRKVTGAGDYSKIDFRWVQRILEVLASMAKRFELNPLPANISLVSILKANDYTTSFYSGDDSSFDRKNKF